ncbi:MAG: hypothetical protein JWO41_360 [Candidatus Saccharibacteria bacterium]|nr:hypothetical protein [Candidatus Saccharibacteria bacterium]
MQQSRSQKILTAVIFVVLVGFLVFAVLASRHSKNTPAPGISRIRGSQAGSNTPTSTTPSNPAPSTPSTSTSSSAAGSTSQLANTGPTQTVTLFIAAVATGTAVAHIHQRRAPVK